MHFAAITKSSHCTLAKVASSITTTIIIIIQQTCIRVRTEDFSYRGQTGQASAGNWRAAATETLALLLCEVDSSTLNTCLDAARCLYREAP